MPAKSTVAQKGTRAPRRNAATQTPRRGVPPGGSEPQVASNGAYVVPLVHTRLPAEVVNVGFWGTMAVAAVTGLVELPVVILVGAAVAVAHHHASTTSSDASPTGEVGPR